MNQWMQIEEQIDEILLNNDLLKNESALAKAKELYEKGIEGRAEGLFFSEFLTYDYRPEGKSLLEEAMASESYPDISADLKHKFSVYEVVSYPSGLGLKDIFTKADYKLVNGEFLSESDLMVGRLLTKGSENFLSETSLIFPSSYKDAFVKGMMEKYNEFVIAGNQMSLEEFLLLEPVILMKFIEILSEVEDEHYESEEDYLVYQSIFLVGDPVALKSKMATEKGFETSLDESGYMVVRLYADETGETTGNEEDLLIAEIVVDGNRVEIESLDEFRLNMAKEKMKLTFGDAIAHFKDEVLSMDDLIE